MAQTTSILLNGIAFNEIGYDSQGTPGFDTDNDGGPTDAEDEFIEFINLSSSTINLNGLQVWDSSEGAAVYTFGAVSLLPGERFVLLTDGGNLAGFQAANPGVPADNGTTTEFQLNNVRDELALVDPSTGQYIKLAYSENATLPGTVESVPGFTGTTLIGGGEAVTNLTGDGQSLQRFPDGEDTWFVDDARPGAANLCFGAGTLIATTTGEVAVETLAIGDTILTAAGTTTRVMWIGQQTAKKSRMGAWIEPVVIRAGALGAGVPHSDLVVTPDHGIEVDGLLINASALVNHDTITWTPTADLPPQMKYYHIETEHHDVILANGAPSETFIDMAGRAAFDNYQEYLDLYGADRIIPEIAMPRIATARLVPQAIKDHLRARPSGAMVRKAS